MTTTTKLSINSFVSEEEQRFLQALPFLVSFGLTLYMPIAARKSLSVWRALQVYDSQEPPKKGFTGERERKRWEKIMGLFFCLSPSIIQLIAFIPIKNEANWPIYSTIRRYAPFTLLAMILIFASFSLICPLLMPIQSVGRQLEASPDKKTKQKKASNVLITRNYTKEPNSMSNIVVFFSIFMSGFIAYHFEKSSDSILIVMVMAIASTILIRPTLVIPMAFKTNTSLRSHVKFFVLIFIGSFALGLALFAIGFCGAHLYLTYMSFTKNASSSSSSKPQASKTSDHVDMVMSQMACLIYTAIWPIFMAYPAFLLNLAYRFDVSKAGHTQVTDEQKEEAIRESREVAKHCKTSKHPKHDYDNVGRTPILLDAIALRLPQDIKTCDLPTFTAAMKTMIATQVASLMITWGFLPSDFNIPYFVRSQKGAEMFPFPFTTNFGVLLAFIFIVPVMLFSAGFNAKKNGQTFGSGVRAIWTYEEKWGAEYFQTKIDHQMDLMDTPEEFKDEKEEKLLADSTTKEDLEESVDLIA